MRFIIRADAYRMSGAGHVMRSSVIAEELIDRGYEVFFVGNLDEIPWVREYISNLGFKGIFKPEDQFPTNKITDTLILDSYEISITDPFIQPKNWRKILVLVDDTTPSYIGNIYLHAGAETSWAKPDSQSSSILLVGLEYLLIRKSLRKLRKKPSSTRNQALKILISSGGSDPFSFAESLVKILSVSTSPFHAYVLAPDFELPSGDPKFELIRLGKAYEGLLDFVDFVFTTAGTSSWEYHFLGIPVALASAVQNQERNYRYQIKEGLSWDLGYRELDGSWKFNESFFDTLFAENQDSSSRIKLDTLVINGDGATRVVDLLN